MSHVTELVRKRLELIHEHVTYLSGRCHGLRTQLAETESELIAERSAEAELSEFISTRND